MHIYVAGFDNDVAITITNLSGQMVTVVSKSVPEGRILDLNLSPYPVGLYLVHLKSKTINETIKVIKQ
ncbi:T9SS type A sorting domain-containing protein [Flavobacterium keumense]|uniref:T9SS type A sorting domain-containing protein n=1 Tax=Flavobacterium keumense TaxID=1306518 RepID=A0ABY8N636_9FLAO|nr:T9SS type A sorting domain-containing protein [Flavobacterium keumense]WGK95105.1 T9SS type A sorting domain-containing protein [Flavobacterium keumense]